MPQKKKSLTDKPKKRPAILAPPVVQKPQKQTDPILLLLDQYYELDYEKLNKTTVNMLKGMCLIQLQITTIARLFNIPRSRLCNLMIDNQTFDVMHARLSTLGKTMLYRKQWQLAMNGNPTMLIWLGKQVLGQSENPQHVDEDEILEGLDIIEDKDK